MTKMKIYTRCTYCKNDISIWTWDSNRGEIKKTKGNFIESKCPKCNKTAKYDIDDFKARESKIALLISLIVFLLGTPVLFLTLWEYLWDSGIYGVLAILGVILIPSFIYGIINKNDINRVRLFNRS
jgi:hypothetical protein